jgi:hypothetical protein
VIDLGALDLGSFFNTSPSPHYSSGHFIHAVRMFLPLMLVLSWIYSVSLTVKAIVREKEARLKEALKPVVDLVVFAVYDRWYCCSGCSFSSW